MQSDPVSACNVLTAIVPPLVWPLAIVGSLLIFRSPINSVASSLALRVKGGAAFRLFQVEVGALTPITFGFNDASLSRRFLDKDLDISASRAAEYERTRNVQIVHKIAPSAEKGQLYDILIYAVPHRGGSMLGLSRIEYYLARPWGKHVYFSDDRAKGFAIRTFAYGPFLILARLFFNDDSAIDIFRYIDFEMGSAG